MIKVGDLVLARRYTWVTVTAVGIVTAIVDDHELGTIVEVIVSDGGSTKKLYRAMEDVRTVD